MNFLFDVLLFFITIAATEVFAWLAHKYVLHGILWFLHEDHHVHHEGKWEKNDIFSALFSLPAVAALVAGYELPEFSFLKPVGFGICAYGILYFVFHDIVVHRRINISFRTQNRYLKRIIRAHRIHHKSNKRNEGEAFGFLYAAKKYEQNDF